MIDGNAINVFRPNGALEIDTYLKYENIVVTPDGRLVIIDPY